MKELIQFLFSIHPLSQELLSYLETVLKTKEFYKKSFILKQGTICNNIYFVEKGLIRCFYRKDDKEVCSWFMKEGDIIISVESFFKQKVSYENIQALEDCTLHYINYTELQHIYHHFPEFNFIGRVLTENYYTLSEQRLYSLRMQRANDRYAYLVELFPELIQRVPLKYIASYLSIAEETLSRIRSQK